MSHVIQLLDSLTDWNHMDETLIIMTYPHHAMRLKKKAYVDEDESSNSSR